MSNPVKVIVVRVGRLPVEEEIAPDERGGHLAGMQAIVGGYIECVHLGDPACPGLELWCNEDGMGIGLPHNRTFRATPRQPPPGFEDAFVIKTHEDLADYGQPGVWQILGDFFLARTDEEGDLAPTTDADFEWAKRIFHGEDHRAAAMMDDLRAARKAKEDASW